MEFYHEPIMINEILDGLKINPSGIYLDCTLGGAGHSSEIIKRLVRGLLVGFDKDNEAIEYSKKKLKGYKNTIFVKTDFKDAKKELSKINIDSLDGVLLDLGVSSHQIDVAERGFSFLKDANLDMRMDKSQKFSAYDVVNSYSYYDLKRIFKEYGEEDFAPLIAKTIIEKRQEQPIKTTFQLKQAIEERLPKRYIYNGGSPSKKIFQAIRIEVNNELNSLGECIKFLISKLKVGGRLCVMTFHSLEEKIVKNVFKELSTGCVCPPNCPKCICNHKTSIKLITHKPITASLDELERNPRSSSAKLRIIEKL